VWIELRQQESEVQLVLRDDGVGFNLDAVQRGAASGKSFGMLGMEERVALLGGQMKITSTPGLGTSIHVVFPLDSEAILPDEAFARQRK
jgi:signal transduction histidine kinase